MYNNQASGSVIQPDADYLALAQEFRAANDEDVLQVLSVQSTKKQADLDRLYFAVVPVRWVQRAWPLLMDRNGHSIRAPAIEPIGRVELAHLAVRDHEISDEEDESHQTQQQQKNLMLSELQNRTVMDYKTNSPKPKPTTTAPPSSPGSPRPQKRQSFRKPAQLRPNLSHPRDFFLLGPSAWRMVKHKFGYDQEIRLRCVFDEDTAGLNVVVYEGDAATGLPPTLQPIPVTGHFGYEALLSSPSSPIARPLPDPPASHAGKVSDDETESVPLNDDQGAINLSPEHQHRSTTGESILLLPPSTTASPYLQQNNWNADECDDDQDDRMVEASAMLRRYGSGLGNLGNTCFMNSTLQCLAHTDPLRKYFLSGAYEKDLNLDNPLGTGGDLATQFAQLLSDMWRTKSTKRGYQPYTTSSSQYYSNDSESITNVVYPRSFKYTLGKHAEQFMGYDQHDSQELATYLLDALHEDTNRVTKKPYVEKPEQAEDESDEEAANKAWELHLKREDSYVMQNFMAQVKSRVQCCNTECGRVSTTFDPIMFLSVPIPGSSERTLPVTFVPLDPLERPKNFHVTVNKMATIADLLAKVQEFIQKLGFSVRMEDLSCCDIWQHDVHAWHGLHKGIDGIRENDETFIYELTPLAQIQAIEDQNMKGEAIDESSLGLRGLSPRVRRYKLDVYELTRLNFSEQWKEELKKYVRSEYSYTCAFDPKRGTTEERVNYFKRLATFIDLCYKEIEDKNDTAGQKRTREMDDDSEHGTTTVSPSDPPIREIEDRCDAQHYFTNVKSLYDVAVLTFIAKKIRAEILQIEREKCIGFPDGVTIEIRMRKSANYVKQRDQRWEPLVMRIPSSMTVFGLREELARRLTRSLRTSVASVGEQTSENGIASVDASDGAFGSPALLILRQIPMTYQRKGHVNGTHLSSGRQLGCLEKPDSYSFDGAKPIPLASPTEEDEKALVAEFVGNHGAIYLEWPHELAERYFDMKEFGALDYMDEAQSPKKGVITVLDCIEKFCQKEQLEETEMWYCNRCKQHVRAWKQFHIYRSPPILLIHLKRFQYSARTHRRDKINTYVDFPLCNLDLTEHVLSWSEEQKPIYDCYAVSNHYGGLGGGHYTAYALNDDGGWCYYDDTRITTDIDPKEVVSEAAYVLYYRRRDVPVGEDFIMDLKLSGISAPTLIHVERGQDNENSEVSSNAPMVDEDNDTNMDVDDTTTRDDGSVHDDDAQALDSGETDVDTDGDQMLLPLQ